MRDYPTSTIVPLDPISTIGVRYNTMVKYLGHKTRVAIFLKACFWVRDMSSLVEQLQKKKWCTSITLECIRVSP